MIQESHSWAYVWRKLKFQNIHTLQCSLQHCNKTAKTQKQYIYIYDIYNRLLLNHKATWMD